MSLLWITLGALAIAAIVAPQAQTAIKGALPFLLFILVPFILVGLAMDSCRGIGK